MAFKIGIPSVIKTITVQRPGLDVEEFTAKIRVLDLDEQEALDEERQAGNLTGNEHVRRDLLELGGIEDANGASQSSDPELIDRVFKDPYAHIALCRAWGEVQRGVSEHTAKN